MRNQDRTFYEIIRTDSPCRLYFDLEFAKNINKDVDVVRVMCIFRSELLKHIKQVLGFSLYHGIKDLHQPEVYFEMDSSSLVKFSRHVVVLLPGETFFINNRNVGKFVRIFCDRLEEKVNFKDVSQLILEDV